MSTSSKSERKLSMTDLCNAENYEPLVTKCLSEKQAKKLPGRHLANILSLVAEMFLTHYDGISDSYETNNGIEVTLKAVFGPQKDELKLSYKPVGEVKDSASATVPDPDQVEMEFVKKTPTPKTDMSNVVEAEVIGLPAPLIALPGPTRTAEEEQAYQEGRTAYDDGEVPEDNPYRADVPQVQRLHAAWDQGWNDAFRDASCETEAIMDHEDDEPANDAGSGEEE